MSGPHGSDPSQPWAGQQPVDPAWQPPAPEQPHPEQPAWGQQPPAYGQQPPAYGGQQYQAPTYGQPQYAPHPDQYGQQPAAYSPSSYPQQPQYGAQPQYGQPPQYGQYDPNQQPPYGQQPSQYDPNQQFTPYSSTDAGSKKSRGIILGVVGALVAVILIVVGVLGFWKPGFFVTTNLDIKAAQTGVAQILSDQTNGYGAKNVQGVNCNNGANPKVVKGGTFDCDVSIDGTKRQVTVTFQDDSGTYEVGRPR